MYVCPAGFPTKRTQPRSNGAPAPRTLNVLLIGCSRPLTVLPSLARGNTRVARPTNWMLYPLPAGTFSVNAPSGATGAFATTCPGRDTCANCTQHSNVVRSARPVITCGFGSLEQADSRARGTRAERVLRI